MISIDTLLEGGDLYRTEFPEGWSFTYRLLTLKEYRLFSALRMSETLHPFYIYKKVFEKCYIGEPKLVNQTMPMFITISIGQLIMYLSGDCSVETIQQELATMRASYQANDVMEVMKRIILTAMPTETYDGLDKLNRLALMRKLVVSEALLAFRIPDYKPLEIQLVDNAPQEDTVIHMDADNATIERNLHPFEIEDLPQSKPLSKALARKLDQRPRPRR